MGLYETRTTLGKLRYSEVAKLMSHTDVPFAVIKGEALSLMCYGKEGFRDSSDVDFLITRKDVSRFEKAVTELGFLPISRTGNSDDRKNRIICLSGSHQLPPYSKKVFGLSVIFDINFDVYWGEFADERIPTEEFLANTEDAVIYGTKVKVLSPVYAFIQVALHHYKEMNSVYHLAGHRTVTTQKFTDISLLFGFLYKNDLTEKLYETAMNHGLGKYIFYLLYYTNIVCPTEPVSLWLSRYRTDEAETILNRYGLESSEYKTWRLSFLDRLNSNKLRETVVSAMNEIERAKFERAVSIFG